MTRSNNFRLIIILLIALVPLIALGHLFAGQIEIPLRDYFDAFFSFDEANIHHIIVREIRFPRLIITIIAGGGLSVAGLLMQTLFNNPLAGPYVLGINSGSSLFVAFIIMTGIPILSNEIGIVSGAMIGAFIFGVIILFFSLYVKSHISLLLIGLMLGSFTSALVYILQTASNSHELKAFTMWAMGSVQSVELTQLPMISTLFLIGVISSIFIVKPLNTLVIGENNAKLLGINYQSTRVIIICITALLAGLITAYCGPIAFVGLAVPNLVKILFKTQNHSVLIGACLIVGSLFLMSCDILIQLVESKINIPINAITSLIGAPFIVVFVLKRLS